MNHQLDENKDCLESQKGNFWLLVEVLESSYLSPPTYVLDIVLSLSSSLLSFPWPFTPFFVSSAILNTLWNLYLIVRIRSGPEQSSSSDTF
jgi:hypothetical protein